MAGGWWSTNNGTEPLLVKFNSEGDTVWVKRQIQGFHQNQIGQINDIVPASGGGFVVAGRHRNWKYKVMRLDDLGDVIWDLDIEFDPNASFDEAASILSLDDGGYLIGGNRFMRWDGGYSVGLIRTTPDTVVIPFGLEALEDGHDFGDSVRVDSVATWEVPVHNFGRRYVSIDSVAVSGDASVFAINLELPFYIHPPDTAFIAISFTPDSARDFSGTLIFFYGDSQSVEIVLTGRGGPSSAPMPEVLPTAFAIHPPYPNPFNSSTVIRYDVPHHSRVKITIYDLAGREVETLLTGEINPGRHSILWNSRSNPAGIYFVRFESIEKTTTTKSLLIK